MENKRKGKVMRTIWLEESEELDLVNYLGCLSDNTTTSKDNGIAIGMISDIIQNAYERGDFDLK